jgi:hypothetical protein
MNTTIERAFAAWLKSLTAFANVAIHAGQSEEEIPNDYPVIYVVCSGTDAPASMLYVGSVSVVISTPEILDDGLTQHDQLVANMRTALRDTSAIPAFFPPAVTCAGVELNKWDDQQDGGRWTTAADITVGVIDGQQ